MGEGAEGIRIRNLRLSEDPAVVLQLLLEVVFGDCTMKTLSKCKIQFVSVAVELLNVSSR